MLLGVVNTLLSGGVKRVTIVASREVQRQLSALPECVGVVVNGDSASEMIDSIRLGLQRSDDAAGYLICPCDAAGIAAEDVRRCLDAFVATPDRIIVATHGSRRGHPIIFPASLAAAVCSPECDAGLNRLARNRPQLVREVACESPGTVANVNTPEDYKRLT